MIHDVSAAESEKLFINLSLSPSKVKVQGFELTMVLPAPRICYILLPFWNHPKRLGGSLSRL